MQWRYYAMINKTDRVIYKLSPWRNIFDNPHSLYSYTDCVRAMDLLEMFRRNYGETPAFLIRKA